MSFSVDTAQKTGVARRTIERDIQIAAIDESLRDQLHGTPIEDKQSDLLKLSRMDAAKQEAVVEKIVSGEATSVPRAVKLLDAERIATEAKPLPQGPFRVIVADPPWQYSKRASDNTKRENTTYATMTIDQIKAMDVEAMACPDSILWLWATNAHLPEAFAIAAAWGFTYKTLLTWDKGRIGMGDWLRGQTEHCLLCVRGKPTVVLTDESTIIREMRGPHSVKPEAFYALVEKLCPGSKIELFARTPRKNWEAFGDFNSRETA